MGMDQTRKMIFMLHNGGHNDYHGNEVYSCDLSLASPVWVRRRNPSTPTGSGHITKFSDGRPCSDHTTNLHIEAEGRWFTPGMASTNYFGYANYQQWWEYKPFDGSGTISGQADDWVDLGSGHPSDDQSVKGLALWDSVDRQIIVSLPSGSNSGVHIAYQSIDNMSGSAVLNNTNDHGITSSPCGAIDTTNRILLLRGDTLYKWIKLTSNATKTGSYNTLSVTGTPPAAANAFHWHSPSNAFITWDQSGGLYKLTPTVSSGNYTSAVWTQVSGAGGPTPAMDAQMQGMWNKIQLINDMGNGDSALVVVPKYGTTDVYVMRLTGAV